MSDTEAGTVSMVGQRLRTAREAKGLALQDVANQTRIPVRHLQHIEDGNWSALPAPTYSIGFARSYANAVGLNGNEVAAELRTEIGSPRPTYQAPQSYYEPADPARVPPKSIAMLAGLIALLLVGGYLIWRSMAVGDPDPAQVAVADTPPPAAQPQQQPLAQPQQATGPVVLTATEEVWLRVYEAGGGASLFQGILKPGQTFQVPATAQAPQIRTGRPQALRVTVGNQQIPPLGAPEQTINDVSLKPADLVARAGQAGAAAPAPATATPAPAPAPTDQ